MILSVSVVWTFLTVLSAATVAVGQIVMIDFDKRDLPVGPPLAMKIAREDLIRQLELHGFRMSTEHTFLPYQYFFVFEAAR